jgi:hypothetical protein
MFTQLNLTSAFFCCSASRWSLLVAPQQGWVPHWRNPMLAAVVVVVAIIGLLIMATLVSRAQQLWLLKEMRVREQACL